jgi:response regulator of citrate/malate metabolism
MNVYDINGNFIASSLRSAADILNVSHVTVKNYCEQRDGAYYLTEHIGSRKVGRPKDIHTKWKRDDDDDNLLNHDDTWWHS